MENVNNILNNEDNELNVSSQHTGYTNPKPQVKNKSIVKKVILIIALCVLLFLSFFVYKFIRVNMAFKDIISDNYDSANVSHSRYLVSNPNYLYFLNNDDPQNETIISIAYQNAVENADDFNEVKKYYNKCKDKANTTILADSFVRYGLKHKLNQNEIDFALDAIDYCAEKPLDIELEGTEEMQNKILQASKLEIYLHKYYLLYYQSIDTTEVKADIFEFMETEMEMDGESINNLFDSLTKTQLENYQILIEE